VDCGQERLTVAQPKKLTLFKAENKTASIEEAVKSFQLFGTVTSSAVGSQRGQCYVSRDES